jgi:hypothetical protein
VHAVSTELRRIVSTVARLGQDVRVDAQAGQPNEDLVDIAADPAVVLGKGRGVDETTHDRSWGRPQSRVTT